MVRSVVFKTPGKLDLRSLTVFGLNSKPNTDSPIGYFGTGLKYAVAVLAREHIPTTLWIDGKKWTIEQDTTKFRDKDFRALFLKRHTLIPKTINLPFTTELGKNWELWQAFRELESNTRDEKGTSTSIQMGLIPDLAKDLQGNTYICVESDKFVEEYHSRDKTFLPDGLTQNDGTERIQVFARKSDAVYYRSIRILDLKEPSENTYNILSQLQLTEDRTAKSEWDVKWEIQNYLGASKEPEIIKRAVSAPEKSFERSFDYEYSTKSPVFYEQVKLVGDDATHYAKSALKAIQPKPVQKKFVDYLDALIYNLRHQDWDGVEECLERDADRDNLIQILEAAKAIKNKEKANNVGIFDKDGSSENVDGREVDERSLETKDTSTKPLYREGINGDTPF